VLEEKIIAAIEFSIDFALEIIMLQMKMSYSVNNAQNALNSPA
jgi:hypothetical protein